VLLHMLDMQAERMIDSSGSAAFKASYLASPAFKAFQPSRHHKPSDVNVPTASHHMGCCCLIPTNGRSQSKVTFADTEGTDPGLI
jgi:hypothetical protein